MDEHNPIIKLVNEGMKSERKGKIERAQELFVKAWKTSSDNHEKCIAVHFVARHQNSPEDTLKWNIESLNRAKDAPQEKVKSYYPSLYLSIGISYENFGNHMEAKKYYNLAFEKISDLPTGKDSGFYSKGVRESILERRNGLEGKMRGEPISL